MYASVVDLRKKMKEISLALARNESVTVLNHGKTIGTIIPPQPTKTSKKKVESHPFFGMLESETGRVDQLMDTLRGGRYRAI